MDRNNDEKEFKTYMIESALKGHAIDSAYGFFFYNLFGIWDYIVAPNNFKTLWIIRISVTLAWVAVLKFVNHPIIRTNLHAVYLALMHLVAHSVILIYYVAFPKNLPADLSMAIVVPTFCMSAFHLVARDAVFLGLTYICGFSALIISRTQDSGILISQLASLAFGFALGVAGAVISQRFGRRAFEDRKLLQAETNRADNLLVKTFPFEVAKELKFTQTSPAKRFDHVTAMFCDIVNFTESSATMSPEELVTFLNKMFSAFDRLAAEHGCEKIKTSGDSYMAVSGAPIPASDHAARIVRLSISLQRAAKNMTLNGMPVKLRIGINSGPIVAGVIGETRFAYDLWGDTVNTASRMESLSPAGGIRITESTKKEIEGYFVLEKLPTCHVKGKGLMDSWLVIQSESSSTQTTTGTSVGAA